MEQRQGQTAGAQAAASIFGQRSSAGTDASSAFDASRADSDMLSPDASQSPDPRASTGTVRRAGRAWAASPAAAPRAANLWPGPAASPATASPGSAADVSGSAFTEDDDGDVVATQAGQSMLLDSILSARTSIGGRTWRGDAGGGTPSAGLRSAAAAAAAGSGGAGNTSLMSSMQLSSPDSRDSGGEQGSPSGDGSAMMVMDDGDDDI